MTPLHTNSRGTTEYPATAVLPSPVASQCAPVIQHVEQEKPMPWHLSMLCRMGMHAGQWEYLAEGHCTQMRECCRCGDAKARTKHQRQWQYLGSRTCQQVRKCGRCDLLSGNRTRHQWGEAYRLEWTWWKGEKRAHRCKRCGAVETWTESND